MNAFTIVHASAHIFTHHTHTHTYWAIYIYI